ncbi:MAG: efflux RND transporter periplasmic adaptor subunit [Acidobacteriota bacterium]
MKLLKPLLIALGVAALAFAAWRLKGLTERPPEVAVVAVEPQDVRRALALTGRIRPEQSNALVPAVRARLVELLRDEGEEVKTGDVLARLDARQVKADLAQAGAALRRDRDELAQLRRDLERTRSLTDQTLLPQRDLEAAQLDVVRSERRVDEGLELLAELEARLDDYVLRSPLDGFVVERPVDPGQVVGPEDVIFELATADDPEVEVEVDERYLGELALGQEALVAPLGGTAEPWPAQVAYIGRRIDRLSGAVIVRLTFAGDAPSLPVGLTLDVNLAIAEHPGSLTVPRSAVGGLGGETWVLAVVDGRTERRDIEVIDWPAPRLVVLGGLADGDLVALDPRSTVAGQEVRVELEDGGAEDGGADDPAPGP